MIHSHPFIGEPQEPEEEEETENGEFTQQDWKKIFLFWGIPKIEIEENWISNLPEPFSDIVEPFIFGLSYYCLRKKFELRLSKFPSNRLFPIVKKEFKKRNIDISQLFRDFSMEADNLEGILFKVLEKFLSLQNFDFYTEYISDDVFFDENGNLNEY